jgi:short subunit dehydrogenase-like uncharacterized protein
METKSFIIYGAYGYTGELIVELCHQKGWKPVLSGRSEDKLKSLAEKFDMPYVVAAIDDLSPLNEVAAKSSLLLNCAGPFSRTFQKVLRYCLDKGLHYTDITGEISVFEAAARANDKAVSKGIMIMPGTGFDVVPSDCLAAFLHQQLPDATHLTLAFKGTGGLSHGTATTMVENIGSGGAIRKDGIITSVPFAYKTKRIDFNKGPESSTTIPWGDVSTAFYSTGIPNIEVYTAVPESNIRSMKIGNYLGWLLRWGPVNKLLTSRIPAGGPSAEKRAKSKSYLTGEVVNAKGEKRSARIITLDGYTLTAVMAVNIAEKIMAGNFKAGFSTPSMAYGPDLIMEATGTVRELA